MTNHIEESFRERYWPDNIDRPGDERDAYQRDKARLIHSGAFRRLQAKTQVMGVGEGDFHRTRLTHSLEVAQIGEGLLAVLRKEQAADNEILNNWLPPPDLLAAACLAHDLGHPPFGHGGELALHTPLKRHGGFEGNAQTLRILTRLEKYTKNHGINPTRRLILGVLKYPVPYSSFEIPANEGKPPKCFYDTEGEIVDWALRQNFSAADRGRFTTEKCSSGKPRHRTLDCSIMEFADDIAYAVHDLEDIVARHMVDKDDLRERVKKTIFSGKCNFTFRFNTISLDSFISKLFGESHTRKEMIGGLVHAFITSVTIRRDDDFEHPLLKYRAECDGELRPFLHGLKELTRDLVIKRPGVQQLERRGRRIVDGLFRELILEPSKLIPTRTWETYNETDSTERRVCDYIAGMTDPFAEKIYGRLYIPGQGTSSEEL